ncbi:MAG: hypothetical protein BWY57_01504 [Betaproteobacteria bacterium ADurb.Bin341]|nr:MAG: hypothetical protein BWY57_01504 [Betaproteobacteria bacterium ADurb.Bin341]
MMRFCFAFLFALVCASVQAGGIAALSEQETSAGLKTALTKGAEFAVAHLGKPDGFLGNPKVRIVLPDSLKKGEKLMRKLGMGKYADELTLTMNRAAEQAVAEAKPILIDAIKAMTVQDAHSILTGGDDSATQYFRRTTSDPLSQKFLPIVKRATSKVKLADKYNRFAGKVVKTGLISSEDADLDHYVTQKAMDGLFLMIAEQERSIRQNPVGTGSSLLKKVFGALGR